MSDHNTPPSPTWMSTKAVWNIIIAIGAVGAIAVIFVSIRFAYSAKDEYHLNFWHLIGATLLIAGASFTSGGLGGFLFGIPKILQNEKQDQAATNKISIVQNDNLVEISDWLTKIIVGVGLTQLTSIPGFLGRIGRDFSPVFDNEPSSTAIIISIIVYFLVIGFFSTYLWTRLFFVRNLKDLNDQLQEEIINKQAEIDKAKDELETLTKQKANLGQAQVPPQNPAI